MICIWMEYEAQLDLHSIIDMIIPIKLTYVLKITFKKKSNPT